MRVKVHKCKNISHPFPIVAWLIMIFQGMKPWSKKSYSHMALEFGDYFYNVRFSGYEKMHRSEFRKVYKLVETHIFDGDCDVYSFDSWIKDFVDHKYDFVQILGLLAKTLGFITFNKLGADFRKMICSELPLAFVEKFYGYHIVDSDNYDLNSTWKVLIKY